MIREELTEEQRLLMGRLRYEDPRKIIMELLEKIVGLRKQVKDLTERVQQFSEAASAAVDPPAPSKGKGKANNKR